MTQFPWHPALTKRPVPPTEQPLDPGTFFESVDISTLALSPGSTKDGTLQFAVRLPAVCAYPLKNMSWFPESQDRLPYTWWKGQPVYLAAILALGAVGSMILTAILMAFGGGILTALIFTFQNFAHKFYLWTPITYILVNPPSIWLVLNSFFLWRFGEQVERHLGRRTFVSLLGWLILVPPTLATLLGLAGVDLPIGAGIVAVEFGVFIAFATLYPRAQLSIIIATVEVWVLAAIFAGVSALSHLAGQDWPGLTLLAVSVGTAIAFIRYQQGHWKFPSWTQRRQHPKLRVVRRSDDGPPSREEPFTPRIPPDVDAVLEKISREGMASLTDEERKALEKASSDLTKRTRK